MITLIDSQLIQNRKLEHLHWHISTLAHRHIVSILVWSLLLVSCDPAYHLTYAVLNDTKTPIYCVDKSKRGPASLVRVEPDSLVMVYEEAGFGYAKSQFKESKPEVSKRFVFYTDSLCSDSSQVIPEKGWKYYRLPIGDYNARVYIREKDLNK